MTVEPPWHLHEYEGIQMAWPTSVLDCDVNEECKRRASLARRACYYDINKIKDNLALAKGHAADAIDTVALWELILEAKQRQEKEITHETR